MYSENNNVNELCLIVINDGNGSQCGMKYEERCNAAEFGISQYRAACKNAANWLAAHECQKPTREDIFKAASIVQEYYRQHVKESAPC